MLGSGRVQLEGPEDDDLAAPRLEGGRGVCRGGSVRVRSGADVVLANADLQGGDLAARDPASQCEGGGAAGDVTLEAHRNVRLADETSAARAGESGHPERGEGVVTLVDDGPPIDPRPSPLAGTAWIHSQPLPRPDPEPLSRVEVAHRALADRTVRVEISPDGSDEAFVSAEGAVGSVLSDGWRYRIAVPHSTFDSAAVEAIRVWLAPGAAAGG